jgi:putative acetyltransferase
VPEFALRPLSLSDMASAAQVHRAAYDDRLPWLAGRYTPEQDLWFFRERLFPACRLTGAFAGERLQGFVAAREDWIDQLYVLPHAQGHGIGSALLAHLQAHQPRLQLWTFRRNAAARAFYEARGFRLVRETDGAENEEREPAALYAREGKG